MKKPTLIKSAIEKSQKQIFHLLYEFALKVCIRYSGRDNDPEEAMYKGFARLFVNYQHLKVVDIVFLKQRLSGLSIVVCLRMVHNMSVIDRFKDREIFSMLMLPADSVNSYLMQAREQLSELLKQACMVEQLNPS